MGYSGSALAGKARKKPREAADELQRTSCSETGCDSRAVSALTHSLEQLGCRPGRIRVLDRNAERQSIVRSGRDRQIVVTLDDDGAVSSSSDEKPIPDAKRSSHRRGNDLLVVLRQSLMRAGIRPGSLADEGESPCTAA